MGCGLWAWQLGSTSKLQNLLRRFFGFQLECETRCHSKIAQLYSRHQATFACFWKQRKKKNRSLNFIDSFTYGRSASSVEPWSHWANLIVICQYVYYYAIKLHFSTWEKKEKATRDLSDGAISMSLTWGIGR